MYMTEKNKQTSATKDQKRPPRSRSISLNRSLSESESSRSFISSCLRERLRSRSPLTHRDLCFQDNKFKKRNSATTKRFRVKNKIEHDSVSDTESNQSISSGVQKSRPRKRSTSNNSSSPSSSSSSSKSHRSNSSLHSFSRSRSSSASLKSSQSSYSRHTSLASLISSSSIVSNKCKLARQSQSRYRFS